MPSGRGDVQARAAAKVHIWTHGTAAATVYVFVAPVPTKGPDNRTVQSWLRPSPAIALERTGLAPQVGSRTELKLLTRTRASCP